MVEESGENLNRADSDDDMNFSDEEGGLKVDGIYIPPPPEPYCSVETKGPRLIITKITNNFFKSYADNQVLGPFHKCFNAIVGPNGSGKSNVIDSMLFVFGYRASKIRSKKLSVLIHNSENFKNVQSCTVSIHFAKIIDKPGEDFEIVPGSEFVVARTANKDNSSYYTLNGRKAHFKEVGVLLKQSGIDLDHNRFLILQGEVEQIAMMNAKGTANEPGMLEYLEDIIGTSRYKIPLEQLNERVEQLSDERMEKLNRVRLIEGELSQLKAPMETAVQFLKQENTIAMKKNILYQKQIVDLGVKQKSLEEKKLESEEGQKEVTEKLAAVVAEKAEKSEKLRGYSTKYDDLTKRKDALKEALDKAEKKDAELQADMVRTNTNRKKTKELLTSEEQKLKDLMKNPEEMDVKIGALERKAEDALQKKARFEEEKVKLINSLKDSTKDIQAKKEVVETKLLDLNRTVNETKYSYNLAESELKVCLSNEEKESKRLADIKKSLETDRESLETHTKEVEKLKQLIPQRESQLKKIQQELTRVRNEEDAIIPEIRRKRSMLEEKKCSMNASRSRGRVLDSLMQQKREGRCPGLFGRLGDLGAIDAKYDVAVSTACGPLDNIVVDTADTARWCIQFLKDHNVGRATIIVLEKQEHLRRYYERKLNTPENVPRLFDLIRVEDDRITPAFYYALRDTLVARDLEQGSRIAYGAQRYRVVTLKGDLIETSGTMSGGGKQVSRGRMGQSVAVTNVDPRELEDMEVSVGQLEQSCRELRQRRSDLETEMNSLTRELTQMKIAYEKYNVELQSLNGRKNNLLAQLRAQEVKAKNTKADPAKVKNLTKTVSEKKTAFEQAKAKADVLQAKVDEFTREIEAMTTGKLLAVDKNIKETNKAAEKFKTEITKLRVSVKTAERNAKQSTDRIAIMKQDIETAEKRLRAMKEQRDEIESDAHKLVTCIEEISETLNEKQEDFSGLKKEVDSLTKTENSLKAEKIEVDQISKEINEQIHELKKKSKQWQLMINELKLNKLPDDNNAPVLKVFEPNELMERDVTAVQRELKALEDEMKKHSVPNLNAIKEYATRREVYVKRSAELEETTEKRKKMRGYYDGLHGRRKEEFTTGFNIIRMKLREMYQMITLGGDADFEMLDTFDPFTEGIQFKVRPPKKTWKLISNLSGGEKTLSSLALVFALHYYKPSPLYFMDEIDAALDFKNVSIIGNYIREKTKNAQFIIISLRSNMFELSDYLIGIYKTDNTTKSLTIDPRTEDQKRKPEDYNKPAKAVQFSSSQATVNKTASTVFGTQPNTIVDSVVSAVSVAESAMDVESSGGVSNGTDRNIEDMEISDTGVNTLNN